MLPSRPEQLGVVQGHIRNNRHGTVGDVRGVPPASHTYFDHGNIHWPVGEIAESRRRQYLEPGWAPDLPH